MTRTNSYIKIKCKCGCSKLPSTGYRGYNFSCVPEELKQELTKNKVAARNKANTASLTRKLYKVQQKCKVPNSGLKRSSTPIAKNSKKRLEELKIYKVLRNDFLKDNKVCRCGRKGCKRRATDVHHKKGRIGWLLNAVEFWLPTARVCHTWINEHPKEAMELGLTISRLNK